MTNYIRGAAASNPITNQTINALSQAASADIDNSVALELWDQIDVAITFATTPTAGAPVGVYLIPSTVDDVTPADAPTPPASNYLVAQWGVQASTTTQHFTTHGVTLPPGKFRYILYNGTSSNTTATSSNLNRRAYHA